MSEIIEKLGMVVHICNTHINRLRQADGQLKASQGYIVRSCWEGWRGVERKEGSWINGDSL
jgi:hypothetical protein